MIRRALAAVVVVGLLAGCYPNEEDRRLQDERRHERSLARIEAGGDWHADGGCMND